MFLNVKKGISSVSLSPIAHLLRYAEIDHAHWSQMVQVLSPDGLPVASGETVPLVVHGPSGLE